jgi:Holliday junction resolvase RusA-like endonuclease
MSEPTGFVTTLPWTSKPKARPRVTKNGTFMPHDYTEWKDNVAEYISLAATASDTHFSGPVSLMCTFYEGGTILTILPMDEGYQRAKHVRADIDNLIGGIMDAMQESGIIDNDSQIVTVHGMVQNRNEEL